VSRKAGAGIAVFAVVLSVCAVGQAFTADGHNDHVRGVVLFVGDSNITLGAATIDWDLTWNSHNDNGYVPVLASRVGAGIRTPDCLDPTGCSTDDYWQVRLGELFGKVQPDAIVNDLGINDAISPGTLTTPGYENYGQKIDWFMSLVPHTIPVLWTNLPCPIEPPDRPGCADVNYFLSLATTRWSNLVLVDWASVARLHPDYMLDPTNVHLSDAGHKAWADTVTAALDARFPG
jgi:lysophospholipase L1-like esterase